MRGMSFMKPSVKLCPAFNLLFHHGNATGKYQFMNNSGNIYLCLCALLHQLSVSFPSEMQFGVMYLATWPSTSFQPYLAFFTFWILEFSSYMLFLVEHTWHPVLCPSRGQCLLCLVASLFSWLMDGTYLCCFVV